MVKSGKPKAEPGQVHLPGLNDRRVPDSGTFALRLYLLHSPLLRHDQPIQLWILVMTQRLLRWVFMFAGMLLVIGGTAAIVLTYVVKLPGGVEYSRVSGGGGGSDPASNLDPSVVDGRSTPPLILIPAPAPIPKEEPPRAPIHHASPGTIRPLGTKPLAEITGPPRAADDDTKCREDNLSLGVVSNSASPCVEVGDVVDHLKHGTYTFNKPSTATLNEAFPIRLVLLTSDSQKADFDGLPGTVVVQGDRPFAQSIEATLSGDEFEISPAGPQARTATLSHPVEWEWKVKPTSAGTKSVTIDVAANILIGSDKNRVQITTLHESIEIQVTILQRLKAYVASVNGAIAAAAALGTSLAGLFGFVPKVRQFFKDHVLSLFRPRQRSGRKQA